MIAHSVEMDRKQFGRAEQHLVRCRKKLDLLKQSADFREAGYVWSEFLMEHQRWFSRMQAAFQDGPSAAWFGSVKNARREVPIIQYLHQARHPDEHGLEEIAVGVPGSVALGVGARHLHIERMTIENGVLTELRGTQDGGPINVQFEPAHLALKTVKNRGQIYEPPYNPFKRQAYRAIAAAEDAIAFMTAKVEEGDKLLETHGL